MDAMPPNLPPVPPGDSAEASPATSNLGSRLFNVIAAPGDVFEELRTSRDAAANWLVPALILVVVSLICTVMIFSQDTINHQLTEITTKAIEKQLSKANMPPEQRQAALDAAEKYGSISSKISAYVAPLFAAFVSPFWWGLLLWLFGKALKGNFSYMKAVEAAGLANFLSVLESIIKTLLIIVQGNLFASPSLALLIKDYDPQNATHNVMGAINIFTFWILAVRSVALAKLSGASFAKAALWVFGFWVVITGCLTAFGFMMQAAFGGK